MILYETDEKKVLSLYEKVLESVRNAKNELKDLIKKTKSNDKYDTKVDKDFDEGDDYDKFIMRKRNNDNGNFRMKSFVKKKKKK